VDFIVDNFRSYWLGNLLCGFVDYPGVLDIMAMTAWALSSINDVMLLWSLLPRRSFVALRSAAFSAFLLFAFGVGFEVLVG